MNRFDIINRIGDKYRVGNTETGEFSYAQALKTVGKDIKDYQKATTGTQHKFLSNDDEEFYQIHVVILYKPTAENKIFSETTWDEDLDENIFDYIRKSASFAYARNHEYIEVKIYMDET